MKKEEKKLSLKKIKILALTKPTAVKIELQGKKRCHWTQINGSCGTSYDLC